MKPSINLGFFTEDTVKAVKRRDVMVVIDALRCCSTIVTALANGATDITPVKTISEARRLKKKHPEFVIAGERKGLKPKKFALGNSPLEFSPENVRGRRIILTTTSGTKAILLSEQGKWVLIGAFLNARAVAEASLKIAENEKTGVSFVLAGKEGQFSLEDFLCAGAITESFPPGKAQLSDTAIVSLLSFERARRSLKKVIQRGSHAQYLKSKGFGDDVAFCARMNVFNIVPFLEKGRTVPLETFT
ncbi:MAG: 2-phosphosulfolactate phosphatase [Candidatus Bathyarchaeota archaeon]|nr:2-phosphosulfolactate phosphatase [Candidatus Bathyarchaeota archaeon]MDH5732606.1 2-phosphosulfolactate phosphatase [Candidatus Bathyarchaeota archaeon]